MMSYLNDLMSSITLPHCYEEKICSYTFSEFIYKMKDLGLYACHDSQIIVI